MHNGTDTVGLNVTGSFTSFSKLQQPLPLMIEALVEPFASNPAEQGTIFCNDGVRAARYCGIVLTQTATGAFQLSYGDGTGDTSTDRRTFTGPTGFTQANRIYHVLATARGPTDGEVWVNNGAKLSVTNSGSGGRDRLRERPGAHRLARRGLGLRHRLQRAHLHGGAVPPLLHAAGGPPPRPRPVSGHPSSAGNGARRPGSVPPPAGRQRQGLERYRDHLLMGFRGIAAIVVAVFATMVAWCNLGLPRLVASPELAPVLAGPSPAARRAAIFSTTSAAGSPGISSAPTTGCSTTSRARSGTGPGATSSAPMTRTPARTTSVSISTARASRR